MKKVIFLIIIAFQSLFIFSTDLKRFYDGVIELHYSNGLLCGSTSSYILDNGVYELWYSMDSADGKVRNIPEKFLSDQGLGYIETGIYSLNNIGNFSFFSFKSESDFLLMKELGALIHPRRMYLYEGDSLFFMSTEPYGHDSELGPYVDSIKTSSYLIEGSSEYKGRNNIKPFLEKLRPWVEGVQGNGIGEWIELETSAIEIPVSSFLISNGYVSFEKPYLYEYNSRVKRLRITSEELGIDFEVEIDDTPNFQEIKLPAIITEKDATFRFEILDVYKGSKWDDTCINLIIPLGDN